MKDWPWDARYDAILYRPHPVSTEHPPMPLRERAAQFAAFKALTGFDEEIDAAGRHAEAAARRRELSIADPDTCQ